jgi:hypothetical protein
MTDETPGIVTRDMLRAKIFAAHEVKKIPVDFFGVKIELRQPVLSDIIKAQGEEDRESAIIQTLVDYAYVPGTEQKVFETGDAASFKTMPFGADFLRVSKALEDLTEINFLDKSATSKKDQTSTNSTK